MFYGSNDKDVHIYVAGSAVPVYTISTLEVVDKSPLLADILRSSLSFCDGCKEPKIVIIAEEDIHTVVAAFNRIAVFNKSGFSIVKGNLVALFMNICND